MKMVFYHFPSVCKLLLLQFLMWNLCYSQCFISQAIVGPMPETWSGFKDIVRADDCLVLMPKYQMLTRKKETKQSPPPFTHLR